MMYLDDVLAGEVEDPEGVADAEQREVAGVEVLEQAAQVPGFRVQQHHLTTRLLVTGLWLWLWAV